MSILGLLALFSLITLLTVYQTVRQSALQVLERDASSLLLQWHGQLDSALKRHAYLPALLAEEQEVRTFLTAQSPHAPTDAIMLDAMNRYLEQLNTIAHTSVIYLMRPDGLTVATSNWQAPLPFIGRNFNFRPYYQQAMQGRIAHYFALGTTSKERGYYFSAPVYNAVTPSIPRTILGVVTVKIDVDDMESAWSFPNMEFVVTDADDIIFMSSQGGWLYASLQALSSRRLAELRQDQRYVDIAIKPLRDVVIRPRQSHQQIRANGVPYLVLHYDMDTSAGWQLYLLADESRVTRSVVIALSLAGMMLVLSVLLVYLLWKNQRQRREYEQHARSELAAKVEERTRELRKTQEELVQAAKMAALGQLSAGINHEINNPLTAIRAYADNAVQFLDIGKTTIVRSNLVEIVGLTERMAAITRQLKAFSRKSTGQIERCDVYQALDSAFSIVQPKLAQTAVVVQQERRENARYVQADQVWLEQILVNLLTNAVEAVQDQAEQQVWVTLSVVEQSQQDGQTAAHVCVQVRDNGAGISDTIRQQVFEAFFTTKTIGKGLGLGLSISYRLARDMHGDLRVQNAPEGGAVFTLTLPTATTSSRNHD